MRLINFLEIQDSKKQWSASAIVWEAKVLKNI